METRFPCAGRCALSLSRYTLFGPFDALFEQLAIINYVVAVFLHLKQQRSYGRYEFASRAHIIPANQK